MNSDGFNVNAFDFGTPANVVVPDGGFFGFNTSVFASRGLAGGLYANLAGIYDNIVEAYVEDVYTDVIEGYTIATIKVKVFWYRLDQIYHLSASWVVFLW